MRIALLASVVCGTCIVVAACSGAESTAAATRPASSADASTPTPGDDAGTVDPCAPGTVVPTQMPTLDAWPKLDPVTATDLTSTVAPQTTKVPGPPAGVLSAKDEAWVFAAVGPAASGQLGVLKRAGSTLTWDHGIPLSGSAPPFGLAQSASGALLAVTAANQVAIVDVAKAEANATDAILAKIPNQSTQGATIDVKFTPDEKFAFAALENDRSVAVVDVDAKKYVGAIPLDAGGITGIAVSPDGSRVYIAAEVSKEFAAANPSPATDQVVGSITVVDGVKARTSPASSVVGRAFVGRAPVRVALTQDGSTLWVTLRGSNAVVALATEQLLSTTCTPVRATIPVGPAPVGIALLRSDALIAVANSNRFASPSANQTVSFVHVQRALGGAKDAVIGQATVGAFPREIGQDGDTIFVSNFNSQSISTLDLRGVHLD